MLASNELLLERVKTLSEEEKKDPHLTEEGMARRLKEYADRNDEEQGNPPAVSFFKKRGIEVLEIKTEEPEAEQQKKIQEYLEKVRLRN